MESTFVALRILGGICVLLIALVYIRFKRVERMRSSVDIFLRTFLDFERRAQIIESEAVTYINSMDKDVSAALYEIRQIIASAREVARGVEELSGLGNYYGLSRAARLANGDALTPDPNSVIEPETHHWEDHIEDLVQFVGHKVAVAARRASQSGYAGGNTPSQTLQRLVSAGIK